MTTTIRAFKKSAAEYDALSNILNAVRPDDPDSADAIKRSDRLRRANSFFGRLIAERDGEIAGFCNYGQVESIADPRVCFVFPVVHPDWQLQKIGTTLYQNALEAITQLNPTEIRCHAREDNDIAMRFLANRGFVTIMREPISDLDIGSFDAEHFQHHQGIDHRCEIIKSLSTLQQTTPDWQQRCFELNTDISVDIPDTAQRRNPEFERYAKVFAHPAFDPDGWFIAIEDDNWVGLTTVWSFTPSAETFYTEITGVRRTHRRRGIATRLKLRAIEYVRINGGQRLRTQNEQNNPMLGINRRLGFVPGPASLLLKKVC